MRHILLAASAAVLFCAAPALAQPPSSAAPSVEGADQVVGLFSATCMHYAGDTAAMRAFLNQQHAPQMPQAARDAFLAGRQGQVYDASYQTVKLALVSLDDGGCEAVAEHADADQVVNLLTSAARENQVVLQPLGAQGSTKRAGVQQTAYGLTIAGAPMHILVSTEAPPPQAVLTLVPK